MTQSSPRTKVKRLISQFAVNQVIVVARDREVEAGLGDDPDPRGGTEIAVVQEPDPPEEDPMTAESRDPRAKALPEPDLELGHVEVIFREITCRQTKALQTYQRHECFLFITRTYADCKLSPFMDYHPW